MIYTISSMSDLEQEPGHIKITQGDLESSWEVGDKAREKATDLSEVDTTHYLDRFEVAAYVAKEFPDYAEKLTKSARPIISDHPDMMERWESARILKRKDKHSYETSQSYFIRALYEEMFGVNQAPGDETVQKDFEISKDPSSNPEKLRVYQGIMGMTPGGLMSHFAFLGSISGVSLEDAPKLNLKGKTCAEAYPSLNAELGWPNAEPVIDLIYHFTTLRDASYMAAHKRQFTIRNIETGKKYPPEYDSIGYRLMLMCHDCPDMIIPVQDEELLRELGFKWAAPKHLVYKRVWEVSQVVYDLIGSGEIKFTEEQHKAIDRMLKIRTHPEMQVFFKYLSPSGYINAQNED